MTHRKPYIEIIKRLGLKTGNIAPIAAVPTPRIADFKFCRPLPREQEQAIETAIMDIERVTAHYAAQGVPVSLDDAEAFRELVRQLDAEQEQTPLEIAERLLNQASAELIKSL